MLLHFLDRRVAPLEGGMLSGSLVLGYVFALLPALPPDLCYECCLIDLLRGRGCRGFFYCFLYTLSLLLRVLHITLLCSSFEKSIYTLYPTRVLQIG